MATLCVIPAIDLKGGVCVRLQQGRADAVTVYDMDPTRAAMRWVGSGAEWLHVVDLDGAFHGKPRHVREIAAIVRTAGIPVEVGGGLRDDSHIEQVLAAGAARAIIGTRAMEHPEELARLVGRFGEELAVGIDARDGWVQIHGWVETTRKRAVELAALAASVGVRTLIYTDTATDGMLGGPNLKAVAEVCDAVSCDVIASGGVSGTRDVQNLVRLARRNLAGAIVGKALYDGAVSLGELIEAAGCEQ
jgi:phosphoribosylformimino-5-aminoimidazole carboxamide ribotide isomerase